MEKTKKIRSLRTLVLSSLAITILIFTCIVTFFFIRNMSHMLKRAEYNHVEELSNVIHGAIKAKFQSLRASAKSWSSWDDVYNYALGLNDAFIEQNLSDVSLLSLYQVDFIIIKDLNYKDLYLQSRLENNQHLEIPKGFSEQVSIISENFMTHDNLSGYTGFIIIDGKSYILCTLPILKSDDSGDPAGTFSFAYIYGDEQLSTLTSLYNTTFYIYKSESKGIHKDIFYNIKDKNTVSMKTYIDNLESTSSVVLEFDHPRVLYTNGWSLIILTSAILLSSTILMMFLLFMLVDRWLFRTLFNLMNEVDTLDQKVSIDIHKYSKYKELYTLAVAINKMLHRLDQSYKIAEQSKISLTVLKNILNSMDAYLYVSNPQTDEILFINDKMKQHFGIEGDGIGQICWKVLQSGFSERCDFCPCYELKETSLEAVIWEEHNTVTNHYYRNTDRLIDWIGDQKGHLQHSVDITDIKMSEIAIQKQLAQQALMTNLSQNFISDESFEVLIHRALEMAGTFMNISRILIVKYDDENQNLFCLDEWTNPDQDIPSRIGQVLNVFEKDLSIVEGMINGTIKSVTSDDHTDDTTRYFPEVACYLVTPILVDGTLWGILDFGQSDENTIWTESDISLAKLVSSLLSGVLSRQKIEDQLHILSSIVEYSPQYISCLTPDGTIYYVNPSSKEITGYSKEELLEHGISLLYDEKTVQYIKDEALPRTLKYGEYNFEIELIRKDGKRRIMSFSSFLTGTKNNLLGGIARDITELRELEAALIAAKELAEQGSRAKSEFLSRMSHEMRTPMNAIIGMTSIARSAKDIAKKEYCLEKIDNASRHLLGVINDILDMSKIEANKFELSYSEFNFDYMLMNVISVVNFRIEEKSQKLSLYIDPSIPLVIRGDEQRLAQVITNLLTNAVKFTPVKGSIGLCVKAISNHDLSDEEICLQIEVTDNGIGISDEQQKKLFHSFEQADGSIARKFGGTGLGLAISKRIVQLMGGDIWIESTLDKGSKFAFSIKVKKGSEDNFKLGAIKTIKTSELNVLAVDDSQETCDYFVHVMNELKVKCQAVTNAEEALKLVDTQSFDLIFVDWNMPDMNGIELTKALKKHQNNHAVIIMISVVAWSDIEKEAMEAGVSGFVPKPLFPSLITDCINKYINAAPIEKPSQSKNHKDYRFPGKMVLLAEDIEINREILLTILEETELTIDCAVNGYEAVQMFRENPSKYDVIFMDIHMPEVDGLEATRRIRALDVENSKTIPIIAMTANVFKEDITQCLAAGMNDHIGKPIDFNDLFSKLDKYLNTTFKISV